MTGRCMDVVYEIHTCMQVWPWSHMARVGKGFSACHYRTSEHTVTVWCMAGLSILH